MYEPDISKEAIQELPLTQFEGDIWLINNHEEMLLAVEMISRETILGFDTETRPSFKKGRMNKVALLQLASPKQAWLFRLSSLGLAPELAEILSNPGIHKVGLALRDDLIALKRLYHFEPGGFTDLQKEVKSYGIEAMGLKKLAAIVLGIHISKSQQVSNWESPILIEPQKRYAATDAWVCLEIFRALTMNI
jgi:ribonuclease D